MPVPAYSYSDSLEPESLILTRMCHDCVFVVPCGQWWQRKGMICDSAKILPEWRALQSAFRGRSERHQLDDTDSTRTVYRCDVAVQPRAPHCAG